ncbi:ABC transporter substrate-binding protein [Paraburkholderia phosphatilytica]|uniref:ABC transporter substrate-binding protein n=1 Tax=Paraburkholderia phosphatilytica TaxID=2282883 RepID=UPI000E4CCCAA|nr:ABC transporter substrate-binding protein [Paraburkholderia phosphatilytica]
MVRTEGAARRRFLRAAGAGVVALALPGWSLGAVGALPGAEASGAAPRIVVLDWGLTEVVLSLDVVPVGVSRPPWYRLLDGDPPLPASVTDTGLLFQPNFEVLQALRPELIVVTPWHQPLVAALERIAPVLVVPMFGPGLDVLPTVRDATRKLGIVLGRSRAADAFLASAERRFTEAASALAGFRALRRPVLLLKSIDARQMTVFGPKSLFGGVLRELGLDNAWQGAADPQGNGQADLAALAGSSGAQALTIGTPPGVAAELAKSPLWGALPFVRERRVGALGAVASFGGVMSAMRFAEELTAAVQGVSA